MAQPDEPTARGYNEEEIRAAEEEFDALVNAGLLAAASAAAAAVAAEPIAATVSDATIAPALTVWNTYVAEVLVPALTRIFKGSAAMFVDTAEPVLLALSYDLTDIAPIDEPATEWMRLASNRLRAVSDIVWEEIRQQLVEGVQAGDGIPELAQRVRDAAGFSEPRARATARTEVAAASNGGSITQARALGLDMEKQWEATSPTDGRTRVTHLAAHHQTVDLGAKFVVGRDLLDFPGDPTGSAEEVINCRCAVTYLNMRRAEETPEVAAGFVEGQHPRDREGKFAEKPGGGGGSALDDWLSQAGGGTLADSDLFEAGAKIGAAMKRDGTTVQDPLGFHKAASEALEGSDITPRQYAEELDRRYGTRLAQNVEDALRAGAPDKAQEEAPALSVDGFLKPQSEPDENVTDFPTRSIDDMDQIWADIESGWSDTERKSLQSYTGLSYQQINRALREGRGDRGPTADTIADVRSAMTPSPTSQKVFRRVSGTAFGMPEFASTSELREIEGRSFTNDGFTSTTVDESVLAGHPAVVHMEIDVPEGTSTAWLHNVGLDHDGELLLDAGTRLEIISVEPMGSFETRVKARVVR